MLRYGMQISNACPSQSAVPSAAIVAIAENLEIWLKITEDVHGGLGARFKTQIFAVCL